MTAMQKLPDDHPLIVAWEKYRATEEAMNSDKWARMLDVSVTMQGQIIVGHPHLMGALWAAFMAGFEAAGGEARQQETLAESQIKHLVDRFLGWRLPKNFNPDDGISAKRPNYAPEVEWAPSGTNLFDATQAEAMVRYMIEGMPASTDGACVS